ncbi:neuronal acetylcholine receptor subunit alpha-10-like [Haliotis rufescens]|uniref:neuronal acetylcholine receptor subunit alpha-10-like n=1 Tax=Haliotis rufescens TaxID=6454 RepID=UPI00201F6451|nr:neuronal acetylcholine receptor subunit alpha-10-like [Haliotis rufescens]
MDMKTVLLLVAGMLDSAACNPKHSLVTDMFRNYDKRVEPFGPNETLNVWMDVTLVEVSDIDERKQVMTTNCWITLKWRDASLAWQQEERDNVTDLRIPSDAIWTPDIRIPNSVEVNNQLSHSEYHNAVVQSSGEVLLVYQVILKTLCTIDVAYFPMDQQYCQMVFLSWTSNGDQLNLTNGESGDVGLYEYIGSAEWDMVSFKKSRQVSYYSCCPEPYLALMYRVVVRRRPLFFLVNLMMPCLVITLVALLGLLVPNESGEKISIGITSLLAMIALLLVISTILPPTSLAIPLIGKYYAVSILIVSLSTGLAVLTLNIHHRGPRGHKLPRLVKTVCFSFLARILFIKIDVPESDDQEMARNAAYDEANHADIPAPTLSLAEGQQAGGTNVVDVLNRLLHTVEQAIGLQKRRVAKQDSLDQITYEWKQLAIVLARALTIIFLFVTVFTTVAMFS